MCIRDRRQLDGKRATRGCGQMTSEQIVGHPEVGTHIRPPPDSFGRCWSDQEFESTPGSRSSWTTSKETPEIPVISLLEFQAFLSKWSNLIVTPAWIRTLDPTSIAQTNRAVA